MTYPDEVLADSPYLYWRLDGDAVDSSGNNRDGTISGAATVDGLIGDADQAVLFDSSSDDVTGDGNVTAHFDDFSLEFVVNYSDVTFFDVGFFNIGDLYVEIDSNGRLYGLWYDGSNFEVLSTSSGPLDLAPGAVHHVVFTFDGTTKDATIYVDGVEGYTDNFPGNLGADLSNEPFEIIADGTTLVTIDEVALYDSTLSAARVAAHFAEIDAAPPHTLAQARPARGYGHGLGTLQVQPNVLNYTAQVRADHPARYYRLAGSDYSDASGNSAPTLTSPFPPDSVSGLDPSEPTNTAARWVGANNDTQLDSGEEIDEHFSQWTFEALVRVDEYGTGGGNGLLGFGSLQLDFGDDPGEVNGVISDPFFVTTGVTLAEGTTYHLAWTYDGATSILYVNGSALVTQSHTGGANLNVDSFAVGPLYFFGDGIVVVDEPAFYDWALPPGRISAHSNARTPAATNANAGLATAAGVARSIVVRNAAAQAATAAANGRSPRINRPNWVGEITADNPTIWWRLNDSPTVTNSPIDDNTSNNNDGKVNVGAPTQVAGLADDGDADHALHFTNADNLVSNGTFSATLSNAALECILDITTLPSSSTVVGFPVRFEIYTTSSGANIRGRFLDAASVSHTVFAPITTGKHHIVLDFNSGVLTIYVDGQVLGAGATFNYGAVSAVLSASSFLVASRSGGTQDLTVDEAIYYNHSLSAARVRAHFATFPGPRVDTQLATATGTAYAPTRPPVAAAAQATSLAPGSRISVAANAGHATAAGVAWQAPLSSALADLAAGTGTVGPAGKIVTVNAGHATAAGVANKPGRATSAQLATAAGQAQTITPGPKVSANAGAISAAGAAQAALAVRRYFTEVMADTPLIYYRLGELTGTFADSSGNGYDGSGIVGERGVQGLVGGEADRAVRATGVSNAVSSVHDFAGLASTNWAVEAWVYIATPATNARVGFFDARLVIDGTNVKALWRDAALNVHETPVQSISAATRHHLVFSYDGSVGTLYVDGVAVQTVNVSNLGFSIGGTNELFSVGLASTIGDVTYDEAAFYQHALSPTRVLTHWAAGYRFGDVFTPAQVATAAAQPQPVTILAISTVDSELATASGAAYNTTTITATNALAAAATATGAALDVVIGSASNVFAGAQPATATGTAYTTQRNIARPGVAQAIGTAWIPPPPFGSYANAVLEDGPYVYWRLGETAAPFLDRSGNGRTGLKNGSPVLAVPGLLGGSEPDKALQITSRDQAVQTTSFSAPSLPAFAVEVWVNVNALGAFGFSFELNPQIQLNVNQDGVRGTWTLADFSTRQTVRQPLTLNTPHHLVFTYDGSVGRMYVDAVQVATVAATDAPAFYAGLSALRIAGVTTSNVPVDAVNNLVVDEFAFYTHSLSAARVLAHYTVGRQIIANDDTHAAAHQPTVVAQTHPDVFDIDPEEAPALGATTVTITGAQFVNVSSVKFGTIPAKSFVVDSPTQITAVTPPHPPGDYNISVTTPGGVAVL